MKTNQKGIIWLQCKKFCCKCNCDCKENKYFNDKMFFFLIILFLKDLMKEKSILRFFSSLKLEVNDSFCYLHTEDVFTFGSVVTSCYSLTLFPAYPVSNY